MTGFYRRLGERALTYGGALLIFLVIAFPMYSLFLTSIQKEDDIRSPDLQLVPRYVLSEHYKEVLRPGHIVPIRQAMGNSLGVSLLTAAITLGFAFPATYALTRLKLAGNNLILGALMSIYLFPVMLFVAPLYVKAVEFGIVDTYTGLLIPYVAFSLPFAIWLLKGFLEGIPVEIEEAAQLDGCSPWQLFGRIVLPLMRPGIFAVMLMVFILSWTEFLTPLLFTREVKILTVALGLYRSTFDIKIGQMAAAAVLTALPVVLLTGFFQRAITQAISAVVDK